MFEQKRGPGRPRKEERRRKAGIHGRGRLKLAIPDLDVNLPGYYCRWVNDDENKLIETLRYDDFDHVKRTEIADQVGESGDENSDLGENVRVLVGRKKEGGPLYAYLLKKKLEYHKEDMVDNEKERRTKENSLRRGTDENGKPITYQYGEIK